MAGDQTVRAGRWIIAVVLLLACAWIGAQSSRSHLAGHFGEEDPGAELSAFTDRAGRASAQGTASSLRGKGVGKQDIRERAGNTDSRGFSILAKKATQLEDQDEEGLSRLYGEAAAAIRKNETEVFKELERALPDWRNASLEESFFWATAWIRFSGKPARIIDALWRNPPSARKELTTRDEGQSVAHHEALDAGEKFDRLSAFSLRELRQRIEKSGVSMDEGERGAWVRELSARAARKHSLDLSLELFALLLTLNERSVAESALASHTPRDQEIIRKVVGF